MKKSELIKLWQAETEKTLPGGLSLAQHGALLESLCGIMTAELLGGGEVPLPGIGKLKTKLVPAREGRNPQTGEKIAIPARRKIMLAVSKDLKESLQAEV